MTQIERLLEMVSILLTRDKITAQELAVRFGVDRRTIYRDVDVLSVSGFPVCSEKGNGGGISLMSHFLLSKTYLTQEEKDTLQIALVCLGTAINPELTQKSLLKLSSLFRSSTECFIDIDFSDWNSHIESTFNTIKKAIFDHKIIHFDYVTVEGKEHSRDVEPYTLWFKEKTWYANCYCLYSKKMLTFRLSRMRNLEITEKDFTPQKLELTHTEHFLHPKTIAITLKIDVSQKYRIYDEFLEDDIIEKTDSYFIVKIEKEDCENTHRNILSYGEYATVLEPLELKEKLAEKIENMLQAYKRNI